MLEFHTLVTLLRHGGNPTGITCQLWGGIPIHTVGGAGGPPYGGPPLGGPNGPRGSRNFPPYGPNGNYMPSQYYQYVQPNRQLPFLATLDLPDLSKLINDPIQHIPSWPPITVKLPSDIPKFNGKQGDDMKNHVMTFHLWCSSNSLMDDSVC